MAKKEIKLPKFSLYSPDDFSYYSSSKYSSFYDLLRQHDIPYSTKKKTNTTNIITTVSSVSLTALFFALGGPWFLFWVPTSACLVGGLILDRVLMVSVPKLQLNRVMKKEEALAQQKKLEAMQPPTFDTAYLRKQIQKWRKVETPEFIDEAYKEVMEALEELIAAIEENDLDLDRWISLFKRYLPDIVDVVKEYESYDDVNDQALICLFNEMNGYLKSEIKFAKLGRRVSHASTIKAYTTYFSGQNGDKTLGGT